MGAAHRYQRDIGGAAVGSAGKVFKKVEHQILLTCHDLSFFKEQQKLWCCTDCHATGKLHTYPIRDTSPVVAVECCCLIYNGLRNLPLSEKHRVVDRAIQDRRKALR